MLAQLDELCIRLLRRKPEEPTKRREILRILGHGRTGPLQRPITTPTLSVAQTTPFVGRERQLRNSKMLSTSRDANKPSRFISMAAQEWEDAVARYFLDQLREKQSDIVILEGRCYNASQFLTKALDGVVDSLTKYLPVFAGAKAEALMPREVLHSPGCSP